MKASLSALLSGALLAAGLVTRFALLSYPRQVVWDEYHFGKFVNGYIHGEYFFDIHPPLGKLLLAATASAGGYDGRQSWDKIGLDIAPDVQLYALRFLPALQGAVIPWLLFATGRAMDLSLPAALLPAVAALFDLCFLVESRLVLTDVTLLLGIILQLYGAFSSDAHAPLSRGWLTATTLSGVGISLAVCTKWAGASALALAGLHSLAALARAAARLRARPTRAAAARLAAEAAARLGLLVALPLAAYVGSFALHFRLLPRTGDGARFMTPAFRASLGGDVVGAALLELPGFSAPSFWAKLRELNGEMLRANRDLSKGHDFSSRWWEWPLMIRTVLYWNGKRPPYIDATRQFARIYCIGSPLVWWAAALAPSTYAAVLLHALLGDAPAERDRGTSAWRGALLLAGYCVNWLPFILVERTQFLYHFLPSLVFALLLLGVLFDHFVPPSPLLRGRQADEKHAEAAAAVGLRLPHLDAIEQPGGLRWLLLALLVYAFAGVFAFFAPLAYGFPLDAAAFEARMWLKSWA
ncbi:hypothetical protein AB1Y20_008115 [Prymnesium parvum]|uniref:Dolichyl-phosphate-mannose--protein mannosyltransferase n=1 Tax=Prymnesium parvum TaxID=97485 RepID=A0AB34ITB3_PRYPA